MAVNSLLAKLTLATVTKKACQLDAPKISKPKTRSFRGNSSHLALAILKNEKSAQRVSFWDGYPADIRGSFARISRPKTSVRVLKTLEK